MDFFKGLVPHIELIITISRTIDLEKTARYGKLSPEYFENSAVCIIHPEDMKRLGLKEGNLKITTKSGSVVVRGVSNEFETSEGIIVIPNGPWANKLIDKDSFQKGQLWFKATIETTSEAISTLEDILKEFITEGN
ncbi:MAG: molybdopterin dinucleotide binding domain-containing protein [Candidatus Helarchaeota archaeon]